MATISRYVLVNLDESEEEWEYETQSEAVEAADGEQAVVEREYEYSDSSLVWTPDGSQMWPPEPCKGCGRRLDSELGDPCETCGDDAA